MPDIRPASVDLLQEISHFRMAGMVVARNSSNRQPSKTSQIFFFYQ